MDGVQRKSILVTGEYDYADSFEAQLSETDERSAEQLFRAGLGQAPQWLRSAVPVIHRHVLRFKLGPTTSPNHVLGWEILSAEPESIRLRADGPLIGGVLVARRVHPSSAVLETFVKFHRPALARVVWTVIAPVHRAVAQYLLATASGGRRNYCGPS